MGNEHEIQSRIFRKSFKFADVVCGLFLGQQARANCVFDRVSISCPILNIENRDDMTRRLVCFEFDVELNARKRRFDAATRMVGNPEGLMGDGLGFLCASPKTGKSWFAMDISISVATGAHQPR